MFAEIENVINRLFAEIENVFNRLLAEIENVINSRRLIYHWKGVQIKFVDLQKIGMDKCSKVTYNLTFTLFRYKMK